MITEYGNILERGGRLKKLLALSATTLVMGVAATNPSWAAVNNPHSVTVFSERDMVVAENYQNSIDMRIEVLRNDVVIADTGVAETVPVADGSGLEVNHGPEDVPQPGDCWVGSTPDIQGGDVVRVTTPAGVESMTVADVGFSPGQPTTNASGDVVAEGFARNATGGPLPLANLAPEVLDVDRNANPVRYRPARSTFDFLAGPTWQASWASADHTATEMQRIGRGEFSIVHVSGIENETTISELGAPGGPAPGCEDIAPAATTGIGSISHDLVNIANANQNLVVSGLATQDITQVGVTLGGKDYTASPANGTWQISIPGADIQALQQGNSNLVASFTSSNNTAPANQTRVIKKDTVIPGLATATPGGGIYKTDQSVSLNSPEGNVQLRYSTDGSDPTNNGQNYSGQQLQVTSSQTIKAVVIDAVGNPGNVATFDYTIDKIAPSLTPSLETGSYDAAQSLALTSDDENAEIRYTTNGATPTKTSALYSTAIQVPSTRTIKAIAYDAAGNTSQLEERTITIRKASSTSLNVATTNMKLGNSRAVGGGVSPNNAGSTVKLTIDRPGTLTTINRNLTLSEFSRFSTAYRPTAVGTYRVTASFAKDIDNLGSVSVMKSFRVVR